MTSIRVAALCCAAVFWLLTGCGSSENSADNAPSSGSEFTVAPGNASKAASVDVCALLSESDAADVARSQHLSGSQSADTQYTLKTEKIDYNEQTSPRSGCKFTISGGGAVATVGIDVVPGDNFSLYANDPQAKKVDGLGDEAVTVAGTTYVRVGDVMMQAGENSATNDFAVAMFTKMAPKLQ
ncbi:hypothetical protein FOS14_17785 [Skermania sp. ID1734]|uniref:hypothetical protein n=1 Tax=Skermania sp. ID1734 TaxID=2597516 RepID=UPI00117BFE65|nr:hypothetical protein [Skermania sp. ID1734]TSD95652.1 hypothetical protein FOS14_17785 [Skermania sp. ID1734]